MKDIGKSWVDFGLAQLPTLLTPYLPRGAHNFLEITAKNVCVERYCEVMYQLAIGALVLKYLPVCRIAFDAV